MIKNLKKLRVEKGLSQQAFAEIIGVTQQSVNKYENHNVEPDISLLIKMADFFNTSVDYLIGHSEINHKIEKVESYELNHEEASLINSFRHLTKEEKESIIFVINNYLAKK